MIKIKFYKRLYGGRICIPEEIRELMNLKSGDMLLLDIEKIEEKGENKCLNQ